MAVVDVRSVYGTTIKQYYIGASTDTKPTDVPVGAKFLESDTNTTYIFGSGKTWVIDPEHQSLNKSWNPDTLEWERMTQPLVNISNASLFVDLASMDIQFQSINLKLTSQVSAQISNTSGVASLIVIADATSTRVGNISTTLNNISTIAGKISNVLSGISNALSGISARLSVLSTVIGSTNALLTSIEAWQDPLAKFGIAFIDAGSATSYYGFQGKAGDWYALRISNGSYLYYYNSANLDTGWGSRATLSYTSFAGMF